MPERAPARHELPEVDAAALVAARAADRLLAAASAAVSAGLLPNDEGLHVIDAARQGAAAERWIAYFARLPDVLRDEPVPQLRAAARRARAAYGPKDSVRDALPPDVTEPFLDAIDRLLRVIARYEAHRA